MKNYQLTIFDVETSGVFVTESCTLGYSHNAFIRVYSDPIITTQTENVIKLVPMYQVQLSPMV